MPIYFVVVVCFVFKWAVGAVYIRTQTVLSRGIQRTQMSGKFTSCLSLFCSNYTSATFLTLVSSRRSHWETTWYVRVISVSATPKKLLCSWVFMKDWKVYLTTTADCHASRKWPLLCTNISIPPPPPTPTSIATILRVCFCLFVFYEHALILISPIVNGVISPGAGGCWKQGEGVWTFLSKESLC